MGFADDNFEMGKARKEHDPMKKKIMLYMVKCEKKLKERKRKGKHLLFCMDWLEVFMSEFS